MRSLEPALRRDLQAGFPPVIVSACVRGGHCLEELAGATDRLWAEHNPVLLCDHDPFRTAAGQLIDPLKVPAALVDLDSSLSGGLLVSEIEVVKPVPSGV